jgi:proline dehydrogenase
MERFTGRLDTAILAVENAKIVENTAAGFDDDGAVSLLFRVAEGLHQEAIDWLRANALVYTDINADFRRLEGVWRTFQLISDNKAGGVVQRLSKGYYTAIDWDVARIIQESYRPAGAGTSETIPIQDTSETAERIVVFEFPYFDKDSIDAAIGTLDSTKTGLADPDGTWYLFDATAEKKEDGTFSIRALYGNTPSFVLVGKGGWLLPSGELSFNYFGVPKQLAQTICDYYNTTADIVRPEYRQDGLVNISVRRVAATSVSVSEHGTENTCRYKEYTNYVYGAAALPELPAAGNGITYALQSVRFDEGTGTYSYQLVKRVRQAQSPDPFISETLAAHETTETQKLGASAIEVIEQTDGKIMQLSVRVNEDCTFDNVISEREVNNQTGTGADNSILVSSTTAINTSSAAIGATGNDAAQGVQKQYINRPTPEGKYSTELVTTTSVATVEKASFTVRENARVEVVESSKVNARNDDLADYEVSADVLEGTTEVLEKSINRDGSLNVAKQVVTSVEDEDFIDGVIVRTAFDRTAKVTASANLRTVNLPSAMAHKEGTTYAQEREKNDDGTWNVRITETVSSEKTVHEGLLVRDSEEIEVAETLKVNQEFASLPVAISADEGQVIDLERRQNEDGTYNYTLRTATSNEVVVNDEQVVLKNEAIERKSELARNVATADIDDYDVSAVPAQGTTETLNRSKNQDGTWDVEKVVESETDQTATDTDDTSDRHMETVDQIIDEERHTSAAAALADTEVDEDAGIITEVASTPKPNGRFETVLRTITSVVHSVASYVASINAAMTVNANVKKNVRPTDLEDYDLEWTAETDAGKSYRQRRTKNPDGTYTIENETDKETDQTATDTDDTSDRHMETVDQIIDEERHTSAATALLDSLAEVDEEEGIITEVVNTPKPNGRFETVLRKIQSLVHSVESYVANINAAVTVNADVKKNVRPADLSGHNLTWTAETDAGKSYRQRRVKNPDGTYTIENETDEETDQTATDADTSDRRMETVDQIIDEERHTSATAALLDSATEVNPATGTITEAISTPKPNGRFETVLRTIRSLVHSVASYVANINEATTVSFDVAKNVRPDNLEYYDLEWTAVSDQGKTYKQRRTKNPDGTYTIENETDEETDQTATATDTSDRHMETVDQVVDEVRHTSATAAVDDVEVDPATGTITETINTPKPNGRFETVLRTIQSVAHSISSYVSASNGRVSVQSETVNNVREINLHSHDVGSGGAGSTYRQRRIKNPDGTYTIETESETITNQVGSGGGGSVKQTVVVEINTDAAAPEPAEAAEVGEIISVSNDPTPEGLWRTTKQTVTAVKDLGDDDLVGEDAGGDYFSTVKTARQENLENRPKLEMPGTPDFKQRQLSVHLNEFGLWDASASEVSPVKRESGDIVVDYGGLVKTTLKLYRNQDDVLSLTAVGQKVLNVTQNQFGKWDYTLATSAPAPTPSYSYYYFGRPFTQVLSTTVTNVKRAVATRQIGGKDYWRVGVRVMAADENSDLLLDNPGKPVTSFIQSQALDKVKWKYTVTVTVCATAASAVAAANGIEGDVEVSETNGGLFKVIKRVKELVPA